MASIAYGTEYPVSSQPRLYVERSVAGGHIMWLQIPRGEEWVGAFCLIGPIPQEHRPR
jgi:hypothetical protein